MIHNSRMAQPSVPQDLPQGRGLQGCAQQVLDTTDRPPPRHVLLYRDWVLQKVERACLVRREGSGPGSPTRD